MLLRSFALLVFVLLLSASSLSQGERRAQRLLSMFQIVRFPNDSCDGGNKNGTCYTAAECSSKGGTNGGSCASGFGVCCIQTINCGAVSSENCTYFDSNAVQAGACSVTICPSSTDICQLRLDFENFVISGPSTATNSVALLNEGVANSGSGTGTAVSLASRCLTDTFVVTSPGSQTPPVICGTNTGEHMYVDASSACNDLVFQLGDTNVGTTAWSIKVTQYSCSYSNLAPSGCTQYYFGPSASGVVKSFNYAGGRHLANQDQVVCIRRERQYCRVCFYTTASTDFSLSDTTGNPNAYAGIINAASVCCQYGLAFGFDCVMIPGASNVAGTMQVNSNFCGKQMQTSSGALVTSVCTTATPFSLHFRSDAYEYTISSTNGESSFANAGFMISYTMDATC